MSMVLSSLLVKFGADVAGFEQGVGKVNQQTEGMRSRAGKAGDFLKKNYRGIGTGAIAMGAAFEAAARKQAPLTESTSNLAGALDIQEKEMRDLILATTDVTFPIEDVIEVMEKGRQQGIKSTEGLQEYAEFWDKVGDATGENAGQLAEAGAALRAVGIDAGEEGKALKAFDYITEETNSTIGDFMQFLARSGPELRDMGMDVNEAATMIGAMQHELGMGGREARTEFRQAVRGAEGDMEALLEELNLTEEQLQKQEEAMDGATGAIERNANAHEESYTPMQKIQQLWEETQYGMGNVIGKLGEVAPALMGVGTILRVVVPLLAKMKIGAAAAAVKVGVLAVAKKVATAAQWLWNAAVTANPIGIIIVAIGALVGAIIWMIKNWDKVTAAAQRVWKVVQMAWENIKESTIKVWTSITDFFSKTWDWIKGFFGEWGTVILSVIAPFIGIPLLIREHWDKIAGFFRGLWDRVTENFRNTIDWLKGLFENINPLEWARKAFEAVINYFRGWGERIKNLLRRVFRISSPSLFMRDLGSELGKGMEIGLERSIGEVSKVVDKMAQAVEAPFDFEIEPDVRAGRVQTAGVAPGVSALSGDKEMFREFMRAVKETPREIVIQQNVNNPMLPADRQALVEDTQSAVREAIKIDDFNTKGI